MQCLDASLTGLGGTYDKLYILTAYSQYSIAYLEMLNVVVALKLCGHLWAYHKIQINCDNMAVADVLQSGSASFDFLATCASYVWLLISMFTISLSVINNVADLRTWSSHCVWRYILLLLILLLFHLLCHVSYHPIFLTDYPFMAFLLFGL